MARFLSLSLACGLVTSLSAGGLTAPQGTTHPGLSMDTAIRVAGPSSGKVFQSVLTIAQQNHLPLGVVIGSGQPEALCENALSLEPGDRRVSDLITAVQSATPGYEVRIVNGVLEMHPGQSPPNVSEFLNLQIARFQSEPSPHVLQGSSLWMAIRGVIAPGKGTDTDTLFSLDAQTTPGLDISNQNVNSIFDTIAKAGIGGVWVLRAAKLKVLSEMTPMPYEIHGYVGEGNLGTTISCSSNWVPLNATR